jgi:hypothetical protein
MQLGFRVRRVVLHQPEDLQDSIYRFNALATPGPRGFLFPAIGGSGFTFPANSVSLPAPSGIPPSAR